MKKLNKNTYTIVLLLTIFCLYSGVLKAQQPTHNTVNQDTVASSRLAKRLSVSRERARQIQWAFNFRNEDIEKLMKDKTLDPKEKQQQLRQLLAQRRMVVDATLNKAQKQQLKNSLPADTAKMQAQREAMSQRHREQLSRTPHQESKVIPMEILKPAKQPSTKQQ
jgi:hypothetical protein